MLCNQSMTGSQLAKVKVAAFMGMTVFWTFMSREQQMQVRNLQEHQGVKLTFNQPSMEARLTNLEVQLRINFQPEEGDVKDKEGETSKEPVWERNSGNYAVTYQALGGSYRAHS